MVDTKSVKRACDILSLYASGRAKLTVTEVSRQLGLNKSTTARLMSTLASGAILKKSADGRGYCLDRTVLDLARVFLSNLDITMVALPYLKELQERTKETALIYRIEGDERVCAALVESPHNVKWVCSPGDRLPLHAGSPGKLLLAYLPNKRVDQILTRTGQPRITDATITSREKLQGEIENIRKQGIAVSHGEHTDFCYSVSAPIRNHMGDVVAALTVAGIIMRTTPEMEEEYSLLVREIASKISRDLGYRC